MVHTQPRVPGWGLALKNECRQLADALWDARSTRQAIAPPRHWLDGNDLASAYAIQRYNNDRRVNTGARVVGRKIGLTSQAVQRQLGVDQPDFGLLFDDFVHHGDGSRVATSQLLQPKIEGEIAFVLEHDVTERSLSRAALVQAAGYATPAFEIVDSAIADWKITLADTVADNASCGAAVISHERRPISALDLRVAGMVLTEDDKVVSVGVGAASLGDPISAFEWLANLAIDQHEPLRRGEIVLTGALGPMVPFIGNKRYRLEIAGFAPLHAYAE